MDPFLGEIRPFGFNFAPRGWAQCNGQLLPIAQNTALYSLLGVNFGGNGTTTFGLPNLQGQVPIGLGQGPGLSDRSMGETGGIQYVTLLLNEIPAHTHALGARAAAAQGPEPGGAVLANGSWVQGQKFGAVQQYATGQPLNTQMSPSVLQPTGGSQPHNNLMPYLTVTFCIALQGIYPQRP